MEHFTRRDMLTGPGLIAAAGLALPFAESTAEAEGASPGRRLKVVVVGGHPDDPESGCGGTMACLADQGHDVVSLYLTRGEAGIGGKTAGEAARIRTAEAEQACRILKVRPKFAGQIDGATEVDTRRYDEFAKVLGAERPDVVLTHWPIDRHRDHRAASLLTFDAWERVGKTFALYYYEVMTGIQSQHFWPTDYIDITKTETQKRAACMAHASQNPEGFYALHDQMNRLRGMECGCKYAEAFIRHVQCTSPLAGYDK